MFQRLLLGLVGLSTAESAKVTGACSHVRGCGPIWVHKMEESLYSLLLIGEGQHRVPDQSCGSSIPCLAVHRAGGLPHTSSIAKNGVVVFHLLAMLRGGLSIFGCGRYTIVHMLSSTASKIRLTGVAPDGSLYHWMYFLETLVSL